MDARTPKDFSGFVWSLPSPDGPGIAIDAQEPPLFSSMDPDVFGIASLDPVGYCRRSWGLAKRLRWFRQGESAILSEIGPLIQGAYEGVHGSLYFEGYRFYAGPNELGGAVVVVTYAGEEKLARRQALLYSREADALKKIGRALNMNQSLVPLCYAAVHEIASVGELAAVLLWTVDNETNSLTLAASTGANRSGTLALAKLSAIGGSSCVAELVATNRQPFFLPSVRNHVVSADLEGRFCYLEPGGVSVWPLVTGGNLIGVLELIGRENDSQFEDRLELFQTVAEHLALAINSATLFETFEQLASHDPLTGMANHRAMHEFLNLRLAESQRTQAEIGVVMIDVDHFRSFNEEEGHDTGDQVLRIVADTIKSIVRPYDLAARYGGEEFTVILPGSSRESTQTIAERIRKKMESTPFETRSGRTRHVTVSMGFSVYPHTTTDAGALLRAADAALYEAKRAGRNRIVFYEGAFEEQQEQEGMQLDALWKWIPNTIRGFMREKLDRIEPNLILLSRALRLSNNQMQMLRGLVLIEEPYRICRDQSDAKRLAALERLSEYRILEPTLLAIDERYDGAGPLGMVGERIPLLTRALHALFALDQDGGRDFTSDSGQFDPEIIELVSEFDSAA